MFGILNINKTKGPTSRDEVNKIERIIRPVKVGHAGTLDPIATGVLIILIGPATRMVDSLHLLPKRYSACFELGKESPSLDTESEVSTIADSPKPTIEDFRSTMRRFIGTIDQTPPIYSAIRINGKRAYELARGGKSVQIPSRQVTIHRLDLISYEYPYFQLDMECSSGTYVRSIGNDIAKCLGTSAIMTALTRTAIGKFLFEDAIGINTLNSKADVERAMLDPVLAVEHLPQIKFHEDDLSRIAQGVSIPIDLGNSSLGSGPIIAALNQSGNLRALLEQRINGTWKARYSFHMMDCPNDPF